MFVVEPDTTEEQINCLAQIYTGQLGGNPRAMLGGTAEVASLAKAPIRLDGSRPTLSLTADGVREGRGDNFKKTHLADGARDLVEFSSVSAERCAPHPLRSRASGR